MLLIRISCFSLNIFKMFISQRAEPHSSVRLENRSLVWSLARPIFFSRIDDSHCHRIHSTLTAIRCFNNDYAGKQPVAWKEYCAEYWFNPFPLNDTFWRPWETSLLKIMWEKEKLLVTSNFSFSHSVFYPFGWLSSIFVKFEIVVCRLFQFGRV